MAITIKDIELKKFLELFTPQSFQEAGKKVISDVDFINLATQLKISLILEGVLNKLR